MRIKLLLGLIVILFSCQNQSKSPGVLSIPLDQEKILASSLFDEVSYLRLKSNGRIFPSKIDQIEFLEDDIYVLDKALGVIFRFSEKGEIISTLEKQGVGPEEYQYLHRFRIDPDNQTVEVYDKVGQKLNIYDVDFNFIESFKLGLFFENFEKIGDEKYLIYLAQENYFNGAEVKNNLVIWDKGQISYSSIRQKPTDSKYQDNSIYQKEGSKHIYFTQSFNDTIYNYDLDANRITEKIWVDFPEKLIGSFTSIDEIDANYSDRSYSTNIDYLVFNERIMSFNYIKTKGVKMSFMRYYHFPKSGKTFLGSVLYNDYDNFNLFRHTTFKDDMFINVLTPEFLSVIDIEKTSNQFQETIDVSIPFEDQFILVFLKVKEDL